MKRLLVVFLAAGTLLTAAPPPVPAEPAPRSPWVVRQARATAESRREILFDHGIGWETESLLRFLNEGFSDQALMRGLPDQPQIKSEVVNTTITELGLRQEGQAVEPLRRILRRDYPRGVREVLERDTERVPLESADELREIYERFMRYNAMVALGLIGDPAAADDLLTVARQTSSASLRIAGATALALNGREEEGLQLLAGYLDSNPPRELLEKAFEAVFSITGRNYAVTEHAPVARREQAVSEFRRWVDQNAADFEVSRDSILRRQVEGVIQEPLPLTSLRGALRASRDFSNYDRRYAARQHLRDLGPGVAPELKAIVTDPLEDLDIRRAAMEWYAAADPDEAEDVFDDLEDDENELIRIQAERLQREIDELD